MEMHALPSLPTLTVLEGGRKPDRRSAAEDARREAIAFTHEVEWAAAEIVNAITGLPVPSTHAINEALRMAHRASAARAELLALGPKDAA
jgi:hypothetical protein